MDQSKLHLGDSIYITNRRGGHMTYQSQTCPYPSRGSHETEILDTPKKEKWLLHVFVRLLIHLISKV